jgi:hypothetical protein
VTRTQRQRGDYVFAFATYGGRPNATVAGRGMNATRGGTSHNGMTLYATGATTTARRQPPRKIIKK